MTIKACPFCGGKPYIERSSRGFVGGVSTKVCYVRCLCCNARSPRLDLSKEQRKSRAVREVIEKWNDRSASTQEFYVKGDFHVTLNSEEHCPEPDEGCRD